MTISKKAIVVIVIVGALAVGGYLYWKKTQSAVSDTDKGTMDADVQKANAAVKKNPPKGGVKWKAGDGLVAAKDTKGYLIVSKTWENYKAGDAVGTFRAIAPDPKTPTNYWTLYTTKSGRYAQIELPNVK